MTGRSKSHFFLVNGSWHLRSRAGWVLMMPPVSAPLLTCSMQVKGAVVAAADVASAVVSAGSTAD